jgi:L-lactate dehydrogenase complex protein LldG
MFLARVRTAAGQGHAYRVHVPGFAEDVGYLGAGGGLSEHFATEVNAVGGEAFVVADLAQAKEQLTQLLNVCGAKSAICWQHELLARLQIDDLLRELNILASDYEALSRLPEDQRRQTVLACGVGITSCDCAIAETGTLLVCSRPGQERLASLIAPIHIAVIERRQIVPDLIDAFAWLAERGLDQLPSNVALITGPSKTGDIELQLTTGVHGPGKWQVIVINA